MTAAAAIYFVDFYAGSDSASGTVTNSPWQHCPGDRMATGTSANTALLAGDTVIFKGGVSYTNTIYTRGGTAANPVTYDGNSSGTFGTGKAVLDGNYLITNGVPRFPDYGAAWIITNQTGVVLRNFQVQHIGGIPMSAYANYSYPTNLLPNVTGYGVWLTDSTNIVIRDCLFQEMGYWTNRFPVNTYPTGQNGHGVQVYSGVNITITNCEFTRMAYSIGLNAGYPAAGLLLSNVVVSGCDFHSYINWMVTVSPSSAATRLDGVMITNNVLHDAWESSGAYWWDGINGGGGFPHFDGIFLGIANLANIVYTNIAICNNLFYWNNTNGGGTAWIFLSNMGGDVKIFNNVCLNNYHSFGFIYVQDGPYLSNNATPINFKFVNNSIFSANSSFYVRWSDPGNGGDPLLPPCQIRIKNNVSYLTNGDTYHTPFSIVGTTNILTECDYNLYWCRETYDQHDIANNTSFAAWRARGYDVHGSYANPLFSNILPGLEVNSGSCDLHLQASSPAIGAGVNLSAFFSTDKDGVLRSSTNQWGIGAYDPVPVSGGRGRPYPPNRLRVAGF